MVKWLFFVIFIGSALLGTYTFIELNRDFKNVDEQAALLAYQAVTADSMVEAMCLDEYQHSNSRFIDLIASEHIITYSDFISVNDAGMKACEGVTPKNMGAINQRRQELRVVAIGHARELKMLSKDVFVNASDCIDYIVRLEAVCPSFFSAKQ